MRVVLDTDVMVAAIRSDTGASRRLLEAALRRRFVLLASVPLMVEYEAVMTRQEHLTASGLRAADVAVLLDAVAIVAQPVHLAFLWRPTLRDANDDMVLETAVNGMGDAIITFNERDFSDVGRRFGIHVCAPRVILHTLSKEQHEKK